MHSIRAQNISQLATSLATVVNKGRKNRISADGYIYFADNAEMSSHVRTVFVLQ